MSGTLACEDQAASTLKFLEFLRSFRRPGTDRGVCLAVPDKRVQAWRVCQDSAYTNLIYRLRQHHRTPPEGQMEALVLRLWYCHVASVLRPGGARSRDDAHAPYFNIMGVSQVIRLYPDSAEDPVAALGAGHAHAARRAPRPRRSGRRCSAAARRRPTG